MPVVVADALLAVSLGRGSTHMQQLSTNYDEFIMEFGKMMLSKITPNQSSGEIRVQATWRKGKIFSFAYTTHIKMILRKCVCLVAGLISLTWPS